MCPALVSGVQQMLSTDFVSTDFERGAERLVLLKGAKEGKNLELLPFNRRIPESQESGTVSHNYGTMNHCCLAN